MKHSHAQKMHVAKMRILRWTCEHTRRDKIKNEVTRKKVGVTSAMNKMRKAKLKWFGHVQRRCIDVPTRKCKKLVIGDSQRSRGRSKKYLGEVIRWDML